MILHNQIGKPVEFSAHGKTFTWEGFGSCDVPEELVEHIKLEKLPIDVTPVPPKVRADQAYEVEQSAERADALNKLRKELESACAEVKEAKAATEAAEKRAADAVVRATEEAEKITVLEDQLRQAKADAAEFEALAKEAKKLAEAKSEEAGRHAAESRQGRRSRK